jgi:hypothetical protein
MSEENNLKPTEDFQRFEDVASKIFQVPIDEVRALEEAEKLKKAKKNKPQTSED